MRKQIQAVGTRRLHLLPWPPEFNPIKLAFRQVQALDAAQAPVPHRSPKDNLPILYALFTRATLQLLHHCLLRGLCLPYARIKASPIHYHSFIFLRKICGLCRNFARTVDLIE
jgi:hypothetical protein